MPRGAACRPLTVAKPACVQALRHTSTTRERRAQERHAVQLAEIEEQQRAQRRAVLDLAAAAELLARENASCTTAWRSCRWAQQPRLMVCGVVRLCCGEAAGGGRVAMGDG